jgi:putative mycofactocin binding protein MftB
VASTDRTLEAADQASAGGAGRAYLVPDWVRVRPEDFGLLFYDTRSTRLTFVRSGDRLVPPAFTGSVRVLGVGAAPTSAALSRLLEDLVAKGLLVAAEVE